jgi:hypothetical protein
LKRRKLRSALNHAGNNNWGGHSVSSYGCRYWDESLHQRQKMISMAGDIAIYNSSGGAYFLRRLLLDSESITKIKNLSQLII